MDDEKLIECVRSYPCLYNFAHPKYLDTKYKNFLWRKIAVELSLTANDWVSCKQRWTNIRDQYKKNIKSQKTVTGQAAKKIKLYKFSEQLQFLKGVDEDRDSISNFVQFSETIPSPSSEIQSMSNDLIDINQQLNLQDHDDVVISPLPTSSAMSPATSSATNEQAESPLDSPLSATQTTKRLKKKMSGPDSESASSILMKYVLMNNKNKIKEREEEEHPMDAFLKGLAPTLKSFSLYYQHLAKGQIFKVIHDLELQQLTENLISSSPSTPIIMSSPSPSSSSMPVILSSPPQSSEQPKTTESIQSYFSQYKLREYDSTKN